MVNLSQGATFEKTCFEYLESLLLKYVYRMCSWSINNIPRRNVN